MSSWTQCPFPWTHQMFPFTCTIVHRYLLHANLSFTFFKHCSHSILFYNKGSSFVYTGQKDTITFVDLNGKTIWHVPAFIFFGFLLLPSKLSSIVKPPLEVASTLQDHCLPQTTVTEPNFIQGIFSTLSNLKLSLNFHLEFEKRC